MKKILGTAIILTSSAMALAHPGHPGRIQGGHIHPTETIFGPMGITIVFALALASLLAISARLKKRGRR